MKKFLFISLVAIVLSSCRVADFTMLSTKNVDMKSEYVMKQRCTAHAFTIKDAVDRCIEKGGGTYLTNVVIYKVPFSYKVVGDVWGK